MNILYTCDNNYVWLMGISTISLFENNKDLEDIHIYLLGEKISAENKELLQTIANKYNRSICIIDVPEIHIPKSLVSSRWPLSAFIRLYSGQLLPKSIERVLYLDCDTIVCGDISNLNDLNIDNKIFWGINDGVGKLYKENIGIDENSAYINAGVLLINLQKLREVNLDERLDLYMANYESFINYADQDVLNGAFNKEIGILSPQYDVMTIAAVYGYDEIQKLRKPTNYYEKSELYRAVESPIIIHYTTNMKTVRPWYSNTNHPYADKFRDYLALSPWKDRELAKMVFNSNESKIIGVIEKLPRGFALSILGFLHATVKPWVIRRKALRGK